jgi:hypothetical protein
LVVLNSIAKNRPCLLRAEVVKTREHRAKSVELLLDTQCVDRVGMNDDPAFTGLAYAFQAIDIGILVSQMHSDLKVVTL